MPNKTKKDLLVEIAQLKKVNQKLENEIVKLQQNKEAQGGTWEYLYRAGNMTTDYYDDLIRRTTLVRERSFYKEYNDDICSFAQVRQFHDGNQVIIITDFNRKTKESHRYASFYKKSTRLENFPFIRNQQEQR